MSGINRMSFVLFTNHKTILMKLVFWWSYWYQQSHAFEIGHTGHNLKVLPNLVA